jgi:hypothetical protein
MDMKNNVKYDWAGDFAEGHGSGKQKHYAGYGFSGRLGENQSRTEPVGSD